MRNVVIRDLVNGTADAAFAVDGTGHIIAWNGAAEYLFGLAADSAVGRLCREVVRGVDECGPVCSGNCVVQQAVQKHQRVGNFDVQVKTVNGIQWCNISVIISDEKALTMPCAIHIVRQVDMQKRLELMVRDFVVSGAGVSAEEASVLLTSSRSPARDTELSERELTVLKMLAKGGTTVAIAKDLHISRTTVHNHIQHVLQKLNAHSRLEAIRRAEHAGLI